MSAFIFVVSMLLSCGGDDPGKVAPPPMNTDFIFGADLSYVNQIDDHGGVFKTAAGNEDAFKIFKDNGTNLVRLRLWHNPAWTKEVYGEAGTQLYSDLADVEESMQRAKTHQLPVLLDFHYSDTWADPGKQEIPEAWKNIINIDVLGDSVYNYTKATLEHMESKGLMPDYIQIGNETNCGFLYTNASAEFPACNVCNDKWSNFGKVANRAIDAIQDASESSSVKPKILFHVADPKNVEWWFENLMSASKANVQDFDIIGFSYYPLWHRTIAVDQISSSVTTFKTRFNRDVIILETAYPWTTLAEDSYSNHFGNEAALTGYPYSMQGQLDLMVELTKEVMAGGGIGVVYWEPAWISSDMKDKWGTGSAWENNTFFDFNGRVHKGIEFMKSDYTK